MILFHPDSLDMAAETEAHGRERLVLIDEADADSRLSIFAAAGPAKPAPTMTT
jgi:hypothetical protein